ncbi:MAG: hypothetical protein AAFX53_05290 [Bacteroidota bacterium]
MLSCEDRLYVALDVSEVVRMDLMGRRNREQRAGSAVRSTTHAGSEATDAQQFPWPILIFCFVFHQGKMKTIH